MEVVMSKYDIENITATPLKLRLESILGGFSFYRTYPPCLC